MIPWDDVATDEGTGIVHIAPGCGAEDFELSRVHDLPVLVPIDEAGRLLPAYGEFSGLTTDEVAAPVTQSLPIKQRSPGLQRRQKGSLPPQSTPVSKPS